MKRREAELMEKAADLILSIRDPVRELDKLEKAYAMLTNALMIMEYRLVVDMLSVLDVDGDA